MVTGILYGEAGSGKSENALCFEEPIIVYDMEDRLKKKIDKHFPEKLITRVNLAFYKADFTEDKVKSFDEFTNEVKKLLALKEEDLPKTVIVDGIGDLRNYAEQKWLTYAKTKEGKPRKSAQNPGDYEEINTLVRNALFPMVNWVRYWENKGQNINLIWTSQMRDNYQKIRKANGEEDSVKAGRIPSHKDWCDFRVNFLVKLWQPKNKDGEIYEPKLGLLVATNPLQSSNGEHKGMGVHPKSSIPDTPASQTLAGAGSKSSSAVAVKSHTHEDASSSIILVACTPDTLPEAPDNSEFKANPRLKDVIEFIRRHPRTTEDIGKEFGFSPEYCLKALYALKDEHKKIWFEKATLTWNFGIDKNPVSVVADKDYDIGLKGDE